MAPLFEKIERNKEERKKQRRSTCKYFKAVEATSRRRVGQQAGDQTKNPARHGTSSFFPALLSS